MTAPTENAVAEIKAFCSRCATWMRLSGGCCSGCGAGLTRRVAWSLDSHPDALDVPDVTSHGWPDECGERWAVQSSDPAHLFPRLFVCTRRKNHTGRHAAGTFTRIAAVWGGSL